MVFLRGVSTATRDRRPAHESKRADPLPSHMQAGGRLKSGSAQGPSIHLGAVRGPYVFNRPRISGRRVAAGSTYPFSVKMVSSARTRSCVYESSDPGSCPSSSLGAREIGLCAFHCLRTSCSIGGVMPPAAVAFGGGLESRSHGIADLFHEEAKVKGLALVNGRRAG